MEENINLSPLTDASSEELANAIVEILESKKGRDIKIIPVSAKTDIADFFVVCSGTSNTHIKTLADEVEYQSEQRGVKLLSYEGRNNNSWILLDFVTVVVHIFSREAREFYNLDKLYKAKSSNTEENEEQ